MVSIIFEEDYPFIVQLLYSTWGPTVLIKLEWIVLSKVTWEEKADVIKSGVIMGEAGLETF